VALKSTELNFASRWTSTWKQRPSCQQHHLMNDNGVAVDSAGHVFVADLCNNRVLVALANRNVRVHWALLTRGESYRPVRFSARILSWLRGRRRKNGY
jgi:hypothetical protein